MDLKNEVKNIQNDFSSSENNNSHNEQIPKK